MKRASNNVIRRYSRLNQYKEDIKTLYLSGKSSIFLSKKYKCTPTSILRILRLGGVIIKKFKDYDKIPDKIRAEIVRLYLEEDISVREVARIVGSNQGSVKMVLTQNKIVIKERTPRKFFFNEDYFSIINSTSKAYFLGLLMADGSNSGKSLVISLQEEDRYILEKLAKEIGYLGNLRKVIPKKSTHKVQYRLSLTSIKLAKSIAKLGVDRNKTYHACFPNIPEEFHSHFIRGVFDGDGCITFSNFNNQPVFSITGYIDLLDSIKHILIKKCNLHNNKTMILKNYSDGIVTIRWGGNYQISKIRKWLYEDCEDLFLIRKKNKMDTVKTIITDKCKKCNKKHWGLGFCYEHYKEYKRFTNDE